MNSEQAYATDGARIGISGLTLQDGSLLALPLPGVTVIVGPNNSGKSTFVREIFHKAAIGIDATSGGNHFVARAEIYSSERKLWMEWLSTHYSQINSTGAPAYIINGSYIQETQFLNTMEKYGESGLGQLSSVFFFHGDAWSRLSTIQPVEMRNQFSEPAVNPMHVLQDRPELLAELSSICQQVFDVPLSLDSLSKGVNLRVGTVPLEAPPVDAVTADYRLALESLPRLAEQGDGMKCLIGLLLPIVTGTHKVLVIDEPEAFLHPPQAVRLGRILGGLATEKKAQIVIATHDKDLLSGILDSQADISILRLNRVRGTRTSVNRLDLSDLREIWDDPSLRHTNTLSGLFHKFVVLGEADSDCRFYSAALEEYVAKNQGASAGNEALFIPTGGKDGMLKLVRILKSAHVPVIACPDLDILNDKAKLKSLVTALGGEWNAVEVDYNIATEPFRQPRHKTTIGHVIDSLEREFGDSRGAIYDAEIREKFLSLTRSQQNPWAAVKEFGEVAFKQQSGAAAARLLTKLESYGLVAVRVGELEGFAPNLEVSKGPRWLPAALAAEAHKADPAQCHAKAILGSYHGLA